MGGFLLSLPRGQGSMSRRDHIHYPSKRRKAVCDPDKEFLFVDHSHSLVPYETVSGGQYRLVYRGANSEINCLCHHWCVDGSESKNGPGLSTAHEPNTPSHWKQI